MEHAEERVSFGGRLRRYREVAGLTREQLAERAGLTANGIAALERGRRLHPYPHTVQALGEALDLSQEQRAELADAARRVPADPSNEAAQPALPVPPTSIVGRRREIAAIESLIGTGESRLLTLTGPGGVGKTRLALEVARNLTGRFPDGTAYVPLAPVGDPALVAPTIIQSLGFPRSVRPPMETLLSHLSDRKMLLVLDNLEQVLEASPQVAELIATCPRLSVLATSRARLRVRGEREYPLQPLETPKPDRELGLRDVLGNPAVEMFVERARDAAPHFQLIQTNATAVVAICRRLDGLPLAIELCAARLRSLTPKELLGRLDRSLPLLTGGARDLPERQRTMRSAIEWSYRLLTAPERRLLNGLSVFRGGWDLEAAEAVGARGDGLGEVLDGLTSLVEQSLVVTETGGGGNTRYRLLVPVQEYAEEQLERSGDANEARRRHANYLLGLAERAELELTGPSQLEWLARLDRENDNLRAALAWSAGHAKEVATQLAPALWRYWEVRGNFAEGRRWLEAALVIGAEGDPSVRAKLLSAAGWMAYWQGDDERAVELASDSLSLCRATGDGARIAAALQQLGLTLMRRDFERGIPMLEESVALGRGLGGGRGISLPLLTLGSALLEQRDTRRARPLLEEGLAISREAGDMLAIGRLLYALAIVALYDGEFGRIGALIKQSITVFRAVGNTPGIAFCLDVAAGVAGAQGDAIRAARLCGASEALREELHSPRTPQQHRLLMPYVESARAALGDATCTRALAEGGAMTLDQAVEYALTGAESPS